MNQSQVEKLLNDNKMASKIISKESKYEAKVLQPCYQPFIQEVIKLQKSVKLGASFIWRVKLQERFNKRFNILDHLQLFNPYNFLLEYSMLRRKGHSEFSLERYFIHNLM